MRNSMRSPCGTSALRSAIPCCTSIAQRTALTGLANSASTPSPVRLDDAPLVLGDLAVDQLAPMRLEARERALLVGADQPGVTRDIRGKNGGEPTLHDSSVVEQSGPRGRGRGNRPDIIWGLRRGSVCAPSGILGSHRQGHDLAPSGSRRTVLRLRLAIYGCQACRTPSLALKSPAPGPRERRSDAVRRPARVTRGPALVSPAMGCCSGRRVAMKGRRRFDP